MSHAKKAVPRSQMKRGGKRGRKSQLEVHPNFSKVMAEFDSMRSDYGGQVNIAQLTKRCQHLTPGLGYKVYNQFFRRLNNSFLAQQSIAREELRMKKKYLANKALDEAIQSPKKISVLSRIALGAEATQEELQERSLDLREQKQRKEESLLMALIDKARYGNIVEGEIIESHETSIMPQMPQMPQMPHNPVSELSIGDPAYGQE